MRGGFEANGGSGPRSLRAEEQIVDVAGFGIDKNMTTFFNCMFDTAGTLNGFGLSRVVV